MTLRLLSGRADKADWDGKPELPDKSDNDTLRAARTSEKNSNLANRLLTPLRRGFGMAIIMGVVKNRGCRRPTAAKAA